MAQHNETGKFGEEYAIAYLEEQGYEIVEKNWRWQKAEIDIIALKNNTLAVVEVKTRSRLDFGLPQDFVTKKKIKLLVAAIDAYVNENDLDVQVRFDIAAIYIDQKIPQLEYLEDAFYPFS
jgi:putative endonuclease